MPSQSKPWRQRVSDSFISGRIIGYANNEGVINQMKLVGDKGFGSAVTMNDFFVDKRERYKYGLRMSNYGQVRATMCAGSDNCFASPNVGFSTVDVDRDSASHHCTRSYGNPGWWQAHCHYHHMTGMESTMISLQAARVATNEIKAQSIGLGW
eukprot:gene11657-13437_t